jgi:hypothetical protein
LSAPERDEKTREHKNLVSVRFHAYLREKKRFRSSLAENGIPLPANCQFTRSVLSRAAFRRVGRRTVDEGLLRVKKN